MLPPDFSPRDVGELFDAFQRRQAAQFEHLRREIMNRLSSAESASGPAEQNVENGAIVFDPELLELSHYAQRFREKLMLLIPTRKPSGALAHEIESTLEGLIRLCGRALVEATAGLSGSSSASPESRPVASGSAPGYSAPGAADSQDSQSSPSLSFGFGDSAPFDKEGGAPAAPPGSAEPGSGPAEQNVENQSSPSLSEQPGPESLSDNGGNASGPFAVLAHVEKQILERDVSGSELKDLLWCYASSISALREILDMEKSVALSADGGSERYGEQVQRYDFDHSGYQIQKLRVPVRNPEAVDVSLVGSVSAVSFWDRPPSERNAVRVAFYPLGAQCDWPDGVTSTSSATYMALHVDHPSGAFEQLPVQARVRVTPTGTRVCELCAQRSQSSDPSDPVSGQKPASDPGSSPERAGSDCADAHGSSLRAESVDPAPEARLQDLTQSSSSSSKLGDSSSSAFGEGDGVPAAARPLRVVRNSPTYILVSPEVAPEVTLVTALQATEDGVRVQRVRQVYGPPSEWANAVLDMWVQFGAREVVHATNSGSDLVRHLLVQTARERGMTSYPGVQ